MKVNNPNRYQQLLNKYKILGENLDVYGSFPISYMREGLGHDNFIFNTMNSDIENIKILKEVEIRPNFKQFL